MNFSKIIPFFLFLLFCGHSFSRQDWRSDPSAKGVVLVVSILEPVRFLDPYGKPVPGKLKIGDLLAEGHYAEAGKGGELGLLLSNGTLLSLEPGTRIRIGLFAQQPFKSVKSKLSDLPEEPSLSQVEIDLNFGALVVKTKKLRPSSSFLIRSSSGISRVQGTQFQLSQNPASDMQLDVTESTVSFTPQGGQPVAVSQGQGLDVSSVGAVTPRPLNPVVAQNVSLKNQSAVQASSEVSLEVMSDAISRQSPASSSLSATASVAPGEPVAPGDSSSSQSEVSSAADSLPASIVDGVLEQNPDAKETRKSGDAGNFASRLAGFNLNARQIEKFYSLSTNARDQILGLSPSAVRRLLSLDSFAGEQADAFFSLSSPTRSLLLQLEDLPLVAALDQGIDESLLLASLDPDGISASREASLPDDPGMSDLERQLILLGDELQASGNGDIFPETEFLNGGIWTDSWVRTARVANQLAREVDLLSELSTLDALDGVEALSNPFYAEVSTLYDALALDGLDGGTDPSVLGGRSISLDSGTYHLGPLLGERASLLLGATDSLSLQGEIVLEVEAGQSANARLLALSGGTLEVGPQASLRTVVADLVVSARQDVLLQDTVLETAREVALHSMRDLQLRQVSLIADSMVRIKAAGSLEVDGLQLSQSLPSLIMEATTIRLSNLDFPASTSVQLNSLKGPIDGRYPNFGTAIPTADQIGRVNFLENVRSGGNLIMDRSSFDQFGQNVTIGKLNP